MQTPTLDLDSSPTADQMAELPLLLPPWQLNRLEEIASLHGLTLGQMLRRVIADFLDED